MKKSYYLPLSLLPFCCLQADDNTISVPEGKIIDYPSLYHDITPSAGPRVIDGFGLFITGDYLYWTAREDNLQFAYSGESFDSATATKKGHLYDLDFRFKSGFRVGLGFSFGHDKWDMAFNYTWYQSNHNKGSAKLKSSDNLLRPAIYVVPNFDYLNSAHASWKFHFNALNLELGRNFYISKFLALRPFIGLNSTWQHQDFHVDYDGVEGATTLDYRMKNDLCFWGIGIRGGIDMAWHLASNWSIYGDAAVSALWGRFNGTRKDRSAEIGDDFLTVFDTHTSYHTIIPVLELGVGLRKEEWFCNDRFHIAIQAGWEEQVWFDLNQFQLGYFLAKGNLVMQGLTAKFRFDF